MNIEELALQDLKFRIYGVAIEGLALKVDKNSPFAGLIPVLVKGWGWKEVCVAARERRVLLLSGMGATPEGCGWLAPVKMWTVERTAQTLALDIQAGTVEQLIQAGSHITGAPCTSQGEERKLADGSIAIDEETARRFEHFLSDDSLFKATAWVAHQSNNEL